MGMSLSSASMSDAAWRLLLDPPAEGAWNVGVDGVRLDGVAAGSGPPTLRFYTWTPACLSLGNFQAFGVVNVEGCRGLGIDIVRRPTGGRAILHDRELTYSVALPAPLLGHDAGILPSYRRLSLALQAGLRRLGPTNLMPSWRPAASQRANQGRRACCSGPRTSRPTGPGGRSRLPKKQQGPDEEGHCSGDGRTAAGSGPCWLAASGTRYMLYPCAVVPQPIGRVKRFSTFALNSTRRQPAWPERTSARSSGSLNADHPVAAMPRVPPAFPRSR